MRYHYKEFNKYSPKTLVKNSSTDINLSEQTISTEGFYDAFVSWLVIGEFVKCVKDRVFVLTNSSLNVGLQ